ncbi:hypothetical protein CLOSBL3_13138 [Clostridiaceae bacterium BL-3]|nr:hypothetical protein CLOSBL3_13138 [Clostridiaceae bacterium BL-3]
MNIGLKLKFARMKKGLNQDQLGKAIGITKQSVSLYERNKIYPSIKTIKKICKVLNIEPIIFFNDDEKEDKNCG